MSGRNNIAVFKQAIRLTGRQHHLQYASRRAIDGQGKRGARRAAIACRVNGNHANLVNPIRQLKGLNLYLKHTIGIHRVVFLND